MEHEHLLMFDAKLHQRYLFRQESLVDKHWVLPLRRNKSRQLLQGGYQSRVRRKSLDVARLSARNKKPILLSNLDPGKPQTTVSTIRV